MVLALDALIVESDSFACSMGFCVCFKRIDQAYYRAVDKTFSNYGDRHQKGSTWVKVILKQVVVPAYWGGLTHFQKCNDSLSDLVVKTGYYQVFTDFASCIAPDEETRQLMMTALLVERTKIDEQWIEKVSECSEGGQLALAPLLPRALLLRGVADRIGALGELPRRAEVAVANPTNQ